MHSNTEIITVEYARIPEACRRYGLSRSRLYLLAAEGLVRFIKVGKATLVDLGSVRVFLENCPAASVVRPPARAAETVRPANGAPQELSV
jgi:hypothetical protein